MAATVSLCGHTPDGHPVHRFELENDRLRFELMDLGAAIVLVEVPDRQGHWENITLGYPTLESYFTNPSYMGCAVGRFANRIGQGRFTLDSQEYQLARNNGPHHLHGGIAGFSHKVWKGTVEGSTVTFAYQSPAGEEGYPGQVDVVVNYHLDQSEFRIDYVATTTAPTIINLTNHAYWNLAGRGPIHQQELLLYADRYLECDETVLPTGTILNVADSPYDFRTRHAIGARIAETPGGYDHCFAINEADGTLRPAAKAVDPESGRCMVVLTTAPGIQLYTANHFDGSDRFGGAPRHGAFCLECQGYPDAPNQPSFPSAVLRPGETYRQTTVHRFSLES